MDMALRQLKMPVRVVDDASMCSVADVLLCMNPTLHTANNTLGRCLKRHPEFRRRFCVGDVIADVLRIATEKQ